MQAGCGEKLSLRIRSPLFVLGIEPLWSEASKLRVVKEFGRVVCKDRSLHELRTPLRSVALKLDDVTLAGPDITVANLGVFGLDNSGNSLPVAKKLFLDVIVLSSLIDPPVVNRTGIVFKRVNEVLKLAFVVHKA